MLYISYIDNPQLHIGVWKKMNGQLKVFKKAFPFAALTFVYNQVAYLWDGERVIEKKRALHRKEYMEVLESWISVLGIRQTYIRYFLSDVFFIKLLKFLQENSIKSVVELATYPYDNEFPFGVRKFEDEIYRKEIPRYVERIATYTKHSNIWGIPCFNLANGYDMDQISVIHHDRRKNLLTMIAVSLLFYWQGFERIFEGMRNYYNTGWKREVNFVLVGTGKEEGYYKKLVHEFFLDKYVYFCGFKKEKELEEMYEKADIGIGSLGLYKRSDESTGSALKVGEYCAHGLPVVCGYQDTRFPKGTPFILQVPNDPSPLDIQSIVDFYDSLTQDEEFSNKIRKYAEEHLSWEQIMRPVIEYLSDE